MEQKGLPGFPANTARAAKRRERRSMKGVEAVLSLARCLEKLLGADLVGSDLQPGELEARPRRRRGRPPVNPPEEEERAAGQIRPGSLRLIPLPNPKKPNYDSIVIRFAGECLEPAPPGAFVWAREIHRTFREWFKRTYPMVEEVPSQRRIGSLLKHLYAKSKHGCYRYKCKIKDTPGPRTDFSN